MSKFKVGDKVKVRSDLKAGEPFGDVFSVTPTMAALAGKTITIESVNKTLCGDCYTVKGSDYFWRNECFEATTKHPIIIITTDGTTTTAVKRDGKRVIATAKAICSPADTFDADYGARLAFGRLMGAECKAKPETVHEIKRHAKVGEWVKILPGAEGYASDFIKKAVKVVETMFNNGLVRAAFPNDEEKTMLLRPSEYVVLEDYKPEPKPEYSEERWKQSMKICHMGGCSADNSYGNRKHDCPFKFTRGKCSKYAATHPETQKLMDDYLAAEAEPEKPKYFTGKVVCIKSDCYWWTVGKVYEVKDGKITADDGDVYPKLGERYTDAEDVRHAGFIGGTKHNPANEFIPFVEG